MKQQVTYALGLAAIALATAVFFFVSRGNFDDAVACITQDAAWDYGDVHWTADGDAVVIFAYGFRDDDVIPRTFIIPVDGESNAQVINAVDVEATATQYDVMLTPRRGWTIERERYAFGQRADDGTRQIFVTDAAGADVQQLTDGDFDAGKAQWSFDGAQIAYATNRTQLAADAGTDTAWAVRVMDADGGNDRLVTLVGEEPDVSWTPDGDIMYSGEDGTFRFDLATESVERVVAGRYPTWSPDGTRMAYLSLAGCDPDLLIADADGSGGEVVYTLAEHGEN